MGPCNRAWGCVCLAQVYSGDGSHACDSTYSNGLSRVSSVWVSSETRMYRHQWWFCVSMDFISDEMIVSLSVQQRTGSFRLCVDEKHGGRTVSVAVEDK